MSPWSAGVGQRRFGDHVRTFNDLLRWTQSCPRTGGVLYAEAQSTIERLDIQDASLSCESLNVRIEDEDGPTILPDCLQGAVVASVNDGAEGFVGAHARGTQIATMVTKRETPVTGVQCRRRRWWE